MKFIFYLILSTCLISCKSDNDKNDKPQNIIEYQTFNSTLLIDGYELNGTIIRNCIFEDIEGDGLQIRDANNLIVENCIFRNIAGNAIRFRNSGLSDGVNILNNEIYDIKSNGILAPEGHINLLIKGNLIYNIALDNTSSQSGAPHHGIYCQGFDAKIIGNEIFDIINDNGNCISIRTRGTIAKNKLYMATDHGISYFSDHPANSGNLLIENNIIYDNAKRGINLAGNGNSENHIGSVLIRFNSIVSDNSSPIGIIDNLKGLDIDLIGNIAIRTDGGSTYIFTTLTFTESLNLFDSGDIGFVDFQNRDFHILGSASANGFATGATNFPVDDIDREQRNIDNLDAGADEI